MRIGIFGGTFNPVHYGHLLLAFFIALIHLGTIGHTPTPHFKAMATGWAEAHSRRVIFL